jgi:hypothetical protein
MSPANEDRAAELTRRNAELQRIVETMLARADEVFASRVWKLGLVAAAVERPFRRLFLGDRRPHKHLTAATFHQIAQTSAAFRPGGPAVTGSYADAPPVEVDADVESTMAGLWNAAGPERTGDVR